MPPKVAKSRKKKTSSTATKERQPPKQRTSRRSKAEPKVKKKKGVIKRTLGFVKDRQSDIKDVATGIATVGAIAGALGGLAAGAGATRRKWTRLRQEHVGLNEAEQQQVKGAEARRHAGEVQTKASIFGKMKAVAEQRRRERDILAERPGVPEVAMQDVGTERRVEDMLAFAKQRQGAPVAQPQAPPPRRKSLSEDTVMRDAAPPPKPKAPDVPPRPVAAVDRLGPPPSYRPPVAPAPPATKRKLSGSVAKQHNVKRRGEVPRPKDQPVGGKATSRITQDQLVGIDRPRGTKRGGGDLPPAKFRRTRYTFL